MKRQHPQPWLAGWLSSKPPKLRPDTPSRVAKSSTLVFRRTTRTTNDGGIIWKTLDACQAVTVINFRKLLEGFSRFSLTYISSYHRLSWHWDADTRDGFSSVRI